ncbi:MAG: ABC transporter permease [Phycisphaerales bacterium]|nr:MAG: ABC transporter permease [Phycisphaerales bacterium]
MRILWQDIRYGFRMLLRNPGFTAVAVLTLALGIGANIAIFSFVDTVLLDPLPVRDSDLLVQIRSLNRRSGQFHREVNPPTIMELRRHEEVFSELVFFENSTMTYQGDLFRERLWGMKVSPNFFRIWGVAPQLGRTFAAHEGKPGQDLVMVLSYTCWQNLYGARNDIVGESIPFNEMNATVVGVMPSGFRFPQANPNYWIAGEFPRMPQAYARRDFGLLARLQPGITLKQTQALLDVIAARHAQDHPKDNRDFGITARPLRMMFTFGALQKTFISLMAAAGFILLIACANLANLLFARTEDRKHELAIRSALGAGRFQLMRQLLVESVLLAVLGGLCGLLVTHWALKALTLLIPAWMPQLRPIQIDFALLGLALALSIVVGTGMGIAPAWFACRGNISNPLKQTLSVAGPDRKRRRLSRILVGLETALAVVLLSGAGLMISSVVRLLRVNPGYDSTNLIRVHLPLPWNKYQDLDRKNHFMQQLHERWSSLPGVDSVGIGVGHSGPESWAGPDGTTLQVHGFGCGVDNEDYLRSIGAHLRAGRTLERRDIGTQSQTILVNEHMAKGFGLGADLVGKTVVHKTPQGQERYEVVGIVGDLREYAYGQVIMPAYYLPYQGKPLGPPHFMTIRTATKPSAILPSLRRELQDLEPIIDAPRFEIVATTLHNSTASHRLYMKCLALAAAVGLLLAALGIYGVTAHSVALRTKEIGIRRALGALPSDIILHSVWEGLRAVLLGIALGLLGTFWLSRFVESLLFETSPHDPATLASVVILLVAVAALAAWIPARRAARIDPMEALRYE